MVFFSPQVQRAPVEGGREGSGVETTPLMVVGTFVRLLPISVEHKAGPGM